MKSATNDPDELFIRARAFSVIVTLNSCRARLVTQMSNASSIWKDKLTETTKAYREIIRDAKPNDSAKAKANAFDNVVRLLAERDKDAEAKATDMKERKAKIALVDEADAEAKAYRTADSNQTSLAFPDGDSKINGMPWATDKALGVIYTALRDIEESGGKLDEYQAALMLELAEAEIDSADLGLEASAAIEDDSDTAEFTDAEAGIEDEDDEDTDLF